jgi:hypothetical protein
MRVVVTDSKKGKDKRLIVSLEVSENSFKYQLGGIYSTAGEDDKKKIKALKNVTIMHLSGLIMAYLRSTHFNRVDIAYETFRVYILDHRIGTEKEIEKCLNFKTRMFDGDSKCK